MLRGTFPQKCKEVGFSRSPERGSGGTLAHASGWQGVGATDTPSLHHVGELVEFVTIAGTLPDPVPLHAAQPLHRSIWPRGYRSVTPMLVRGIPPTWRSLKGSNPDKVLTRVRGGCGAIRTPGPQRPKLVFGPGLEGAVSRPTTCLVRVRWQGATPCGRWMRHSPQLN